MDLKSLLDAVLALGSNISIKEGKEIYKNKLVSNLTSKNINGVYHIYSKINESENKKINSCHIKFNLKEKKVIGATCTCDIYEEFSKHKRNYICKHIVATIFNFYIVAKTRIEKVNKDKSSFRAKVSKENSILKKELKLDVEIKAGSDRDYKFFDIQFKIGENFTYLITKIDDFIKSKKIKKPLRINGEFLFNPNLMFFSESDERILKFLYEAHEKSVLKNNDSFISYTFEIIEEKFLRINKGHLRYFLELISSDKKIKFNYDYVNYNTYVIKENLPLSFTVKMEKENIVLTTKKKLPIPLNNDFNIFLNDRKIYLPSENQVNYYKSLWKELKASGKIEKKALEKEIFNLLIVLKNISNDIVLGEGIKRLCKNLWKPKLYFTTENGYIKCKASVNYLGESINILDENRGGTFRDYSLEDKICRSLERLRFIKKDSRYIFIGNDDELYEFLTEGLKSLKKLSEIEFSKSFNNVNLIGQNDIEGAFEGEEDNFYFKYNIEGLEFHEYKDILKALSEEKSYYKTKSDRLLDLRDIGIMSFFNMLDYLAYKEEFLNGLIEVDKSKAMFIEDRINGENLNFIKGSDVLKIISERLNNRKAESLNKIEGFNGVLRSYQLTGVNYLKALSNIGFGGILADEMGLGKTIQVIAFLLSEDRKRTLIVTPTSLIYNWKEEFDKFAPNIKVGIIHGSKISRKKILDNKEDYNIFITTYGTIKNDINFYNNEVFDYCIIDEAQNIKNSKAQNTKIIKEINAKVKFALTGTPIENTLKEIWSIFDFIMPGYLFDEKKFKKKFIDKGDEEIKELKSLINPFILRRLKRDVISELPEKIEKKYFVSMTTSQKLAYKNYMKEIKLKLKSGNDDKITILSYLTRLRQICQDPILVNKDYTGGSGKLDIAIEIINESIEKNNKILVFSQFTSVLKSLKEELTLKGIKSMYLDGATIAKERVKLVEDFNKSEDTKVFLISLKAGGTGLNLTSANIVIHMDPWWNPAIEDQATDRAHRIGQKNVVEVIKLIAKETIEEKIVKLQEDKREIINNVMNDNNLNINNISKLTNEEILELFK